MNAPSPARTLTADFEMPAASSDIEGNCRILDSHGFCVHKAALGPDEVTVLKDRLDEQAALEREQGVALLSHQSRAAKTWFGGAEADGSIAPWQGVPMLINKGRPFIDLMMNPTLLAYVDHAFGGVAYMLASSTGLILRNGCEPMLVHSDQQFTPYQTERPLFINFMVCLTPFTNQNGATRVLPFSHTWGHYPPVAVSAERGAHNPEPIETVGVECDAGDVIVFDSRTWHQSGHHQAANTRYSVTTFYNQSWVRPLDDYVQSLHDEVMGSMSESELAMLGFRTDTSGRFDPRYPGDRQAINRKVPFVPELKKGSSNRAVKVDDMGEMKNLDEAAKRLGVAR